MQQNSQSTPDAIASARAQFRTCFKTMAARGTRWHLHAGSSGVVLMEQGTFEDYDAPVLVSNVQAMSEDTMVCKLHNAIFAAAVATPGSL